MKINFESIINHQVALILKEKGLSTNDLSNVELLRYKYEIALMLLEELGA